MSAASAMSVSSRATMARTRSNSSSFQCLLVFTIPYLLILAFTIGSARASIHIYNGDSFREVGNAYLVSGGSEGVIATRVTPMPHRSFRAIAHDGRSYIRSFYLFCANFCYYLDFCLNLCVGAYGVNLLVLRLISPVARKCDFSRSNVVDIRQECVNLVLYGLGCFDKFRSKMNILHLLRFKELYKDTTLRFLFIIVNQASSCY